MSDNSNIYLSVIIPAYNEAKRLPVTLEQVLSYLAVQSYTSEVIIVDDGSTDETSQLVCEWPDSPVPLRLTQHSDLKNHGKGASVRLGMLAAQGRFRLFMDADNSTTIDHIERFWPHFEEGYDLVIGSRSIKGAYVAVHQPWYKELAGRIGNLIIRLLAVPGIADTQAGFKMFTNACAEAVFARLTIERWGFDVEVLAIARYLGFRIKEAPITWINSPESKVRAGAYLDVLAEVWRVRRNLRLGIYR